MSITHQQAQDLPVQEQDAKRDRAAELDFTIREGVNRTRKIMWETAEALHEFDELRGWTLLGHDTLGEWLAQPDVTLSRATFYRLVEAYRELSVKRQIPKETLSQLDVTKVQIALPAIKKSKEPLQKTLDNVAKLGAQDLRELYTDRPKKEEEPPEEPDFDDMVPPVDGKVGAATDDEPVTADEVEPEGDVIEGTATTVVSAPVLTDDQILEELVNAYESGADNPRLDRQVVGCLVNRFGELTAADVAPRKPVEQFVRKFREAPRSRHVPDWVEELAQTIGA